MDAVTPLARNDLACFGMSMRSNFERPRHISTIVKKLHDLKDRKIKRLMVFMPPRHGKSFLINEIFPAWYLGLNPTHRVITTSYGQDLANDFGRRVRNIMRSHEYLSIFPDSHISGESNAAHRFDLVRGGMYYAVGAGAAITGRGADLIIIDDVVKNRQEAESEQVRKTLKEWYGSTLYTRLAPNGVVVLVNTRWHQDDLPGYILSTHGSDWEVLSMPALSETGTALWPEWFPISTLQDIKRTIGSKDFESLYQQHPTIQEGALIKRKWLRYWESPPDKWEETIITVDATFTGKSTSDFVSMQVWSRYGVRKYWRDQIYERLGITETIDALIRLCNKYPEAKLKLIENKANGPAIEDLLKLRISGMVLWEPQGDKVSRVNAVSPQYEAGNVYFPNPHLNPWVQDAVEEFVSFPNSTHDDRTDAMSMALLRLEESTSRGVGTMRVLR